MFFCNVEKKQLVLVYHNIEDCTVRFNLGLLIEKVDMLRAS